MDYLSELESKSIYIIREAYAKFKDISMLWSIGKDSTTLLWLCRKAFLGKLLFPVMHIDTGYKFKEIYEFRDEYTKKWNLRLIVGENKEAKEKGTSPEIGHLKCCNLLKTEALKQTIAKYKFSGLLLGIRRDEHGIRAKERYFSPRDEDFKWNYKDQPAELWDQYKSQAEDEDHFRIHPLLHWREIDIWEYIRRENIPIVDLYFSDGTKRYRSIGCECCCSPVESTAKNVDEIIEELKTTKVTERSGRSQDKESIYVMQKLRALGYM